MAKGLPEARARARFVEKFLLPLVAGGEVHAGAPIGHAGLVRMLDAAADSALEGRLQDARWAVARELQRRAIPPRLDEESFALAVALHDLLFLYHPDAGPPGARSERLVERVGSSILAAFEFNGTIAEFREQFVIRVRALQATLTDPELRVFALRVADVGLGEKQWIESVAAYAIRKAVERWRDLDEDEFHTRVASLAGRFARAEAVGFNGAAVDPEKLSRAFRFVLTRPDGREVDQVVRWTQHDDETMEETKTQLHRLLAGKGSAGLAAAAQVVWDSLTPKTN